MAVKKHGFSVGIDRDGNTLCLSLCIKGRLVHEDYQLLTSLLDNAVAGLDHPRINVLMDMTELEGWEMRAAWDDLKLGLQYGQQFQRIAMVGNRRWQQVAAKLASWFIGGEAQFFEQQAPALEWLNQRV
ncbi:MAG: STAS/SEC14 domain-containing protein [Gammaproteobacteria bacterium]|nr:STAS/SEC14 domain-containing protein [Gammaproteobacteria bacterium]